MLFCSTYGVILFNCHPNRAYSKANKCQMSDSVQNSTSHYQSSHKHTRVPIKNGHCVTKRTEEPLFLLDLIRFFFCFPSKVIRSQSFDHNSHALIRIRTVCTFILRKEISYFAFFSTGLSASCPLEIVYDLFCSKQQKESKVKYQNGF